MPSAGALLFISISAAWAQPLTVTEVAPGVFVHQGTVRNLHAAEPRRRRQHRIRSGTAMASRSSTLEASERIGEALREAIRETTDKPIRYVINTHMHPDHVSETPRLRRINPFSSATRSWRAGRPLRAERYLATNRKDVG